MLRTPWTEGAPVDPAALQALLQADTQHSIAAVFVVHTDTASGITADLAAMRRAIDAAGHPALFVVDAVASLAAAPLAMDALGANVVMGASQKGLMLPPGLAFVAADAARDGRRARATPRRATTGTGCAGRARCSTASSAARRRWRTWRGCRRRWG